MSKENDVKLFEQTIQRMENEKLDCKDRIKELNKDIKAMKRGLEIVKRQTKKMEV